jgi:hypothetical protein
VLLPNVLQNVSQTSSKMQKDDTLAVLMCALIQLT